MSAERGKRFAEVKGRFDHVVYRIGSEFSYEETPCFCAARQSHSVLDTVNPEAPQ